MSADELVSPRQLRVNSGNWRMIGINATEILLWQRAEDVQLQVLSLATVSFKKRRDVETASAHDCRDAGAEHLTGRQRENVAVLGAAAPPG